MKKKTGNMSAISMKLMEYAIWILIGVIVICLGVFGSRYAYKLGYQVFDREPRQVESKELSITIADGQTTADVAEALEDAGIIDSAWVFRIQGILFDLKVLPGTYSINLTEPSLELFEKFNEGPSK